MIIANGTIEIKKKTTGGGIDAETGHPVKTTVSWGDPIPCQYRANKYSNNGVANGEAFTIATYEILIEEQPFTAEQLRMYDNDGRAVGEFSVISVEPLEAVGQVRITV